MNRKFTVVRELKPEEERKQLSLLESSNYNHAVYVTNTMWEFEVFADLRQGL